VHEQVESAGSWFVVTDHPVRAMQASGVVQPALERYDPVPRVIVRQQNPQRRERLSILPRRKVEAELLQRLIVPNVPEPEVLGTLSKEMPDAKAFQARSWPELEHVVCQNKEIRVLGMVVQGDLDAVRVVAWVHGHDAMADDVGIQLIFSAEGSGHGSPRNRLSPETPNPASVRIYNGIGRRAPTAANASKCSANRLAKGGKHK
jgi:hypothetical protein